MLPRLTIGFIVLSVAVALGACSSSGVTQQVNVGPNFPVDSFYATNSTQNAISIYTVGQKTGTGPAYNIGGSNTALNGPQYIAFDKSQNLWVTNYNKGTGAATLVEIEALATGNVLPLFNQAIAGRPRGIAISGTAMAIADTNPTNSVPSQVYLFNVGGSSPYNTIGGAKTQLSVPGGIAMDSKQNIYVTNLQGASVEKFILPTPSPTPTGSPTASPSPSPSPSPTSTASTSPSPSPSPSPTATPININPAFIIQGPQTGVTVPTGVAVDADGAVFISDQGNPLGGVPPAILIYPKPVTGHIHGAPKRKICGPLHGTNNTMLNAPTDVAVDTSGNIYVADSLPSGAGVLLEFSPSAGGAASLNCTGADNVAPMTTFKSPGAVTGIGLVP